MVKSKVTSKTVAKKAAKILKSRSAGSKSKSAAGSALSQTKAPKKVTSKKAASKASSVLRNKRRSKIEKSAAGSALVQRPSNKSKRKK